MSSEGPEGGEAFPKSSSEFSKAGAVRGAGVGGEGEVGDRHRSLDFTLRARERHRRVTKPRERGVGFVL